MKCDNLSTISQLALTIPSKIPSKVLLGKLAQSSCGAFRKNGSHWILGEQECVITDHIEPLPRAEVAQVHI